MPSPFPALLVVGALLCVPGLLLAADAVDDASVQDLIEELPDVIPFLAGEFQPEEWARLEEAAADEAAADEATAGRDKGSAEQDGVTPSVLDSTGEDALSGVLIDDSEAAELAASAAAEDAASAANADGAVPRKPVTAAAAKIARGAASDRAEAQADLATEEGSAASAAHDPLLPDAAEDAVVEEGNPFPTAPIIEAQKAFWIPLFTEYTYEQGVLHDGRLGPPVFESIDLTGFSRRAQRRTVGERMRTLRNDLRALATVLEQGLPLQDERTAELLALLPDKVSPREVRDYSRNLRFQRGLASKFRKGIQRSGQILAEARRIMARHGVPQDLAYLPHVESSFNNNTYSKSGAGGMWQFTRGTGRMFMTVSWEIDERFDPLLAAEAAAKLLRANYDRLGTWPLAITAYNHGPSSLRRIVGRMETNELGHLIENYEGGLFKFASKNFYAEFLAAREVAQNYEHYFGPLEMHPPLVGETVKLPFYVDAKDILATLDIPRSELERLNPALRASIWLGTRYIPPGTRLRLPPSSSGAEFLAAVPAEQRQAKQKRLAVVRVQSGDTLYDIGRRNGVSWQSIAAANNISSYRRIRPGQDLVLPLDGRKPVASPVPVVAEQQRSLATVAAAAAGSVPSDAADTPTAGAGAGGGVTVVGPLDSATRFQELRVIGYDIHEETGEIIAAYGETIGFYADWAEVSESSIRNLNSMARRSTELHPGRPVLIPLQHVPREEFDRRRMEFHRSREAEFFTEYNITEMVEVRVQPGQSSWKLAQNNNVPMWLFYRENPKLIHNGLQPGMMVMLPVVEESNKLTSQAAPTR